MSAFFTPIHHGGCAWDTFGYAGIPCKPVCQPVYSHHHMFDSISDDLFNLHGDTNMSNQITVPFHGANLFITTFNNEPYAPMKPIVEGMGLTWQSQHEKLKQRFTSTITEIVMVANDGKSRKMICLPLRKLAGWLQTISPNKVNPEIRDKVIQYQNECDDVLYEYWTTGEVKSKSKTTVDQRTPLRDAVNLLVSKKALTYSEAYSVVHQRFNVASIEDLPLEQLSQAIEYVHKVALEGEYIAHEKEHTVNLSLEDIYRLTWLLKASVRLREGVEAVTPALDTLGSSYHGSFLSMALEYKYTIKEAKEVIFNKLKQFGLPKVFNGKNFPKLP